MLIARPVAQLKGRNARAKLLQDSLRGVEEERRPRWQIPVCVQRRSVKPTLTGRAQVRYTFDASVEDAMEELRRHRDQLVPLRVAASRFRLKAPAAQAWQVVRV